MKTYFGGCSTPVQIFYLYMYLSIYHHSLPYLDFFNLVRVITARAVASTSRATQVMRRRALRETTPMNRGLLKESVGYIRDINRCILATHALEANDIFRRIG